MTEHGSGKKDETNANLGLPPEDGKSEKKEWEERKTEQTKEQTPAKHKPIGKLSSTDYVTFFRHYY
jgi:hypothetical protein